MKKISNFNNLTKSQKILTLINYITSLALCTTCFVLLVIYLNDGDPQNRKLTCILTGICYLLPFVIQIIFRTRLCPALISIYIVFLTIAAFLGSCLTLNFSLMSYDKFQHGTWGYIACLIGIYFLCRTKEIDLLKPFTVAIIFIGISLATASVWELIEFTGDTFFNQTAQGKPVNGIVSVTDSMLDILCHTIGTIIFTIQYSIEKLTKKNLGIKSITNAFKIDY